MKNLLTYLSEQVSFYQESPLTEKDVITAQKELVREGYPFLPLSFVHFLQEANGISSSDSAILGIPPTANENLDIVAYNIIFNQTTNMVILGYDDLNFLVYNSTENKYQIVDREDNVVVEDYPEENIKDALIGILHVNNEEYISRFPR